MKAPDATTPPTAPSKPKLHLSDGQIVYIYRMWSEHTRSAGFLNPEQWRVESFVQDLAVQDGEGREYSTDEITLINHFREMTEGIGTVQQRMLHSLRLKPKGRSELAKEIGCKQGVVDTMIQRMRRKGLIISAGDSKWRLK